MRLRVGTAADTATVARIFTACWQDAYLGVVAAEVLARLDIPAAAALWTPLLAAADPDGEVIVAEDGGGAVNGLIRFGLDPEERSRGHVFSLYVDPIVAAAGIGGALLGQAVSWFCSRRMAAKVEYLYAQFNDTTPQGLGTGGSLFTFHHSLDILRLGLNYGF